MSKKPKEDEEGIQVICRNKRAFHEYEISDLPGMWTRIEGTEVRFTRRARQPGRSLRASRRMKFGS